MNAKKTLHSPVAFIITVLIIWGLTMMLWTTTSYASTSISSVKLKFSYDTFEEDSDSDEDDVTVSLYSSSSHYDISSYEISNMPSSDEWSSGTYPKLVIYLTADDDYTFASGLSSSDFSFTGTSVSYYSSTREDSNQTLKLTVKLKAVTDDDDDDTNSDLEVSDLEWDEDDATASWTGADDASKYYIKLYKGSSLQNTYSTTNTSYDLSSKISSTGTYTFKVRAYDGSDYGDWEESDDWYISSSTLSSISSSSSYSSSSTSSGPGDSTSSSGAWLQDTVGIWYCNADRSYTVSNWQYISDKWYYFNESGYMMTGWILWNSTYYYCGSDGAMYVSTTTPDGYTVDSSGAWIQ